MLGISADKETENKKTGNIIFSDLIKMENALIQTDKCIVYQSDIDYLCEEYLETLHNPELIYTKSAPFNGLLLYLYKHNLQKIIGNKQGNSQNRYDYDLLDKLFDTVYLPLCYRFNKTPTVMQFCLLCGLDNNLLSDLKNGFYRQDNSRVNKETQQKVKKWSAICESSLVSKTVEESSIGSMFILKAVHGYKEQDSTINLQVQQVTESPESIAEKYSDAEQPKMIDLTE